MSSFSDLKLSKKTFAALIGPTECELEGPIPIENKSKILI
jgi:hypothetical protein